MVGKTLGHYKILEKIGAGGMGEVYLAEDTKLGRQVAIKVLPPDLAANQERLDRFQREARTLAALDHPNIVHLYSVEHAGDVHFLTMQLIKGERLSERIPKKGMPMDEFFEIAIPLADALRAAHEKGITHRDLKPSNVMVDSEDRVKVLDFGLAKLRLPDQDPDSSERPTEAKTQEGVVLGTVPYMSPEQVQGQQIDHRTDIFSLGILLYEMLAGVRPFQGDNSASVISAILRDTPQRVTELKSSLPTRVSQIIHRCLEKAPKKRYQSAYDLRRDLEDIKNEVASGEAAVPSGSTARIKRLPSLSPAVVLAALAVLAVFTALYLWKDRLQLPRAEAPRIASLVVLPLQNFTGESEQEFFVDGMTDALITDLSKIGSLKVLSRTTAMRYKGTDKTLPEIARELSVDAVVEGSVVRDGEQVQIKTQLIDAASDSYIWSETFERELSNVLTLQSDIARSIAAAIKVSLSPEEESRLVKEREVNPETYQAYLRGMFWLNKGTPEGIMKGMAFLREAVEKDPGDPLAYAGLALGYITVAHGPQPPADALHQAKSAAEKAIRLDDTLAEAHAALGFIQGYYEWEWELARKTIDHALEISPSLAIAHYHDSWLDVLFGRMEEAIAAHKRAQQMDPLMPLHTAWLGEIYRMEGRYEEAIAEAEKSIEMAPGFPPGHFVLAMVYEDQGRYEEAFESLQRAAEVAPPWKWALGGAYARVGRAEEAQRILAELEAQEVTPWNALWQAQIHVSLGNHDEAFRWLNYEHPHAWVPWVRVLTWFEPLREDPRFGNLLRKMNLPPVEG
jgi:serine/threonine-protein kinase